MRLTVSPVEPSCAVQCEDGRHDSRCRAVAAEGHTLLREPLDGAGNRGLRELVAAGAGPRPAPDWPALAVSHLSRADGRRSQGWLPPDGACPAAVRSAHSATPRRPWRGRHRINVTCRLTPDQAIQCRRRQLLQDPLGMSSATVGWMCIARWRTVSGAFYAYIVSSTQSITSRPGPEHRRAQHLAEY